MILQVAIVGNPELLPRLFPRRVWFFFHVPNPIMYVVFLYGVNEGDIVGNPGFPPHRKTQTIVWFQVAIVGNPELLPRLSREEDIVGNPLIPPDPYTTLGGYCMYPTITS